MRLPGPRETRPVGPGDVLNFNLSAGIVWGEFEGRWLGKTAATSRHRPAATGQWSSQLLVAVPASSLPAHPRLPPPQVL